MNGTNDKVTNDLLTAARCTVPAVVAIRLLGQFLLRDSVIGLFVPHVQYHAHELYTARLDVH